MNALAKSNILDCRKSQPKPFAAAIFGLLILINVMGFPQVNAQAINLQITEVVPSMGKVEVTNMGANPFTLESNFPFCHRFRYNPSIPSGTTFQPGESKVFDLNFSNPTDSDLWLYRDSNFGSGNSIISGLKWGPANGVGRTGIALSSGKWGSQDQFAPVPPSGMALQLTGEDPTMPGSWTIEQPDLGQFSAGNPSKPMEIKLKITNLSPEKGTYFTPVWLGFHDGTFDIFNSGEMASPELERLAEDGDSSSLMNLFEGSGVGSQQTVVTSGNQPPVFAPENSQIVTLTLDANDPKSQFLSFATMIIPSNDAFIGNEDPEMIPVFNDEGELIFENKIIMGSMVYDAGTEVNDEIPSNTAFLEQAAPNTGSSEDSNIQPHPGFLSAEEGSILSQGMFSKADFKAPGFTVFSIELVTEPQPDPMPKELAFRLTNLAPEKGTYLTPVWLGFHDGTFDLFNSNEMAGEQLERLAEDGDSSALMEMFDNSESGSLQKLVTSGNQPPVFSPGDSQIFSITLDANDPNSRYLSFASMVIPSNDAFIGNADPMMMPVFDDQGNIAFQDKIIMGSMIYDAGTEVNDEVPSNTAFLEQASPNTGEMETMNIQPHSGFKPANEGSILSNQMFSNADFTAPDYNVFAIELIKSPHVIDMMVEGDTISIDWVGGTPPFTVQWASDISSPEWNDVGAPVMESDISFSVDQDIAFFRILDNRSAILEQTRYSVKFDAIWSAETHPTQFPSTFPHFSGLVGATHNSNVSFWGPGVIASPGIELMAETGSKSILIDEVEAEIADGNAHSVLSGGGIGNSPSSVTYSFYIEPSHPLVSLVSMIAPSPDWFVGVHDLSLIQDGQWLDELEITLMPYDSGTDSGTRYTSSNADTQPKEPIFEIMGFPFLNGDTQMPIGSFKFTRLP